MPRAPRKLLQNLTLRDPLQEIIDKQLASQIWNEAVCVEAEICFAIDEKYSCSHHEIVIQSLRKAGLTHQEISEKTGYCKRQVIRYLKKIEI